MPVNRKTNIISQSNSRLIEYIEFIHRFARSEFSPSFYIKKHRSKKRKKENKKGKNKTKRRNEIEKLKERESNEYYAGVIFTWNEISKSMMIEIFSIDWLTDFVRPLPVVIL